MKVRVNETLAKGLTKRLYNELVIKQEEAYSIIQRDVPSQLAKHSRKSWVNATLDAINSLHEDTSIFTTSDGKKKPTIFIFALSPREGIQGRFCISAYIINTKKCHLDALDLPILLSKHAIERVFLRINSTNTGEVLNELREALSQFVIHILDSIVNNQGIIPQPGTEINLGSENGMFIGTVTEDNVIVFTTFVDKGKLSESQLSSIT
jgi:hypothetical protein